jgi:hypothetical protein
MIIYLFRDDSSTEVFAFSIDVTGQNIPLVTPRTEWIFVEAIETLRFPDPWDVDDFEEVLDHLKAVGYYLFQAELIKPLHRGKRRSSLPDC